MWSWTLNWGEIRSDLVVGSCPIVPGDIDRICVDAGVGALLSLQTDDCRSALGIDYGMLAEHGSRRGLVLVNAPIRDFDGEDQRTRLPAAVRTLSDLLARGRRTYVHCTAGINRAPLVALGYLTFVEGMAFGDAMAIIQRGRPEASPYLDAYHGCREDALAPHRAAVALRAASLLEADPEGVPDGSNRIRAEQEILSETFKAHRIARG